MNIITYFLYCIIDGIVRQFIDNTYVINAISGRLNIHPYKNFHRVVIILLRRAIFS
jgi:hypothetical protein